MSDLNPVDAIGMALTPGSIFNQQNRVFRSAAALAQFASIEPSEVLGLIAESLADRVTIRPSVKHPENGPLIALTEYLPDMPEEAVELVKIVAGNMIESADEGDVVVTDVTDGAAEALQKHIGEQPEAPDENPFVPGGDCIPLTPEAEED